MSQSSPIAQVAAVLHGFADRGVFRDFSEHINGDDTWAAEFRWSTSHRLSVVADSRRGRLTCLHLLPDVERGSPLHLDIDQFVVGRHRAALPPHRRLDPSRARAFLSLRSSRVSLSLRVAGTQDWSYAASKLVDLIHELLVYLNLNWAIYAQHALGASLD